MFLFMTTYVTNNGAYPTRTLGNVSVITGTAGKQKGKDYVVLGTYTPNGDEKNIQGKVYAELPNIKRILDKSEKIGAFLVAQKVNRRGEKSVRPTLEDIAVMGILKQIK